MKFQTAIFIFLFLSGGARFGFTGEGGGGALYSGEKKQAEPGAGLTVKQFFAMQLVQYEGMKPMMEQKMSENLLPTSPVYQKMSRVNQLNSAMMGEFFNLTKDDNRPVSVMMDPTGDLYPKLFAVWQKYEPEFRQLQMELAPYGGAHVMTPPFLGPASGHENFPAGNPGMNPSMDPGMDHAMDPSMGHDPSSEPPAEEENH